MSCICTYTHASVYTYTYIPIIYIYIYPVYFTFFRFFPCISSGKLKGLKKLLFFDLVVFVYISLALCSKDVCLGLSLFQSIYKLKFWEMRTAAKISIYISILQRILKLDKIEKDWNKLSTFWELLNNVGVVHTERHIHIYSLHTHAQLIF